MMFCRFYPFFKLFHQPYHHPHHPHHKVVRYVTYYDEPYSYHHHSYSHTPHHKYNSYSIDRKDDISSRLSVDDADDTKLMPLDHMCEGLSSPEKELCVLCWGETEPERRGMCYKVSLSPLSDVTSHVPGPVCPGHPGVSGHLSLPGAAVSPVCAGHALSHP